MHLIVGKNGFIANKLINRGDFFSTSSTINSENNSFYLDLLKPDQFDYTIINKNTKIIMLAAVSSPDECSANYEKAYKINVIGTRCFIKESIKRGANVLFFSSDVIYGNTSGEVNEDSETNPTGKYAEMKNTIEKEFIEEENFKVFRLSYVLSSEDKYLSYLKQCLIKNKTAEVFHPFARKIIYIEDVLDAIENILKHWDEFKSSKFNLCGDESISRKDIAEIYNRNNAKKLNYTIVTPDKNFWEARPKNINISSKYLAQLLNRKPTKIEQAIKLIVQENK